MSATEPEVIADQRAVTVLWDPGFAGVRMQWKAFCHSAEYRQALELGLTALHSRGSHRWLADLRHHGIVVEKDQQWVNDDWFPRATARGGIRALAMVMPHDRYSSMSIDQIMLEDGNRKLFMDRGVQIWEPPAKSG